MTYIMNGNGIFDQAIRAKEETEIAKIKEKIDIIHKDWWIDKQTDPNTDLDDFWDKLIDDDIIGGKDDITGPEKDGEDDIYILDTEDGYQVEIIVKPDGSIEIGDIVSKDKLLPKVTAIQVTNKTSDSIEVAVTVSRLEEGNLSYYYKKESEKEYHELEGKQNTTDLTATFTGLEQEQIYNIKVVAKNKIGSSGKIINAIIRELEVGTVRQKGETVWSNNKASIELETSTKLAIQYQINGIDGTWTNYEGSIGNLNHNDTVYAVLTDGKKYGNIASIEIRDGAKPSATISGLTSSVTVGSSVSATVTHTDNESGVKLASCKWIFKTSSTKIGTDESLYTGTFSSESGKITWSTSSTGTYYLHVLTVDNAGNKEETVSSSVSVRPRTISVTGVSVSPTSVTLDVGSTKQLTATVSPSNATNKSVTWSSSNTSVATVSSSGLVTAKAAGSATITVRTSSGSKTATCSVTVRTPTISVTGVSVSPTSATLNVGSTKQLTATISPSNATNKSVTWSSSNSSVATVSSTGLVTAKVAGSATITVKTVDGSKTASCSIKVEKVEPTGITLNVRDITLTDENPSFLVIATPVPAGAVFDSWSYQEYVDDSNKEYLKITAQGPGRWLVTGNGRPTSGNCQVRFSGVLNHIAYSAAVWVSLRYGR